MVVLPVDLHGRCARPCAAPGVIGDVVLWARFLVGMTAARMVAFGVTGAARFRRQCLPMSTCDILGGVPWWPAACCDGQVVQDWG